MTCVTLFTPEVVVQPRGQGPQLQAAAAAAVWEAEVLRGHDGAQLMHMQQGGHLWRRAGQDQGRAGQLQVTAPGRRLCCCEDGAWSGAGSAAGYKLSKVITAPIWRMCSRQATRWGQVRACSGTVCNFPCKVWPVGSSLGTSLGARYGRSAQASRGSSCGRDTAHA